MPTYSQQYNPLIVPSYTQQNDQTVPGQCQMGASYQQHDQTNTASYQQYNQSSTTSANHSYGQVPYPQYNQTAAFGLFTNYKEIKTENDTQNWNPMPGSTVKPSTDPCTDTNQTRKSNLASIRNLKMRFFCSSPCPSYPPKSAPMPPPKPYPKYPSLNHPRYMPTFPSPYGRSAKERNDWKAKYQQDLVESDWKTIEYYWEYISSIIGP